MQLSRRRLLLGMGLAATGMGCGGMNPFLLPYMFSGGDAKQPAEFPLKLQPKKQESKVVVLVSSKTGMSPDLAGVDRMLNAELITVLDAGVKSNEEKVKVLKMPAIDEFRTEDPNWRSAHPFDVGKKFNADYLIDVEIEEMTLFEPDTRKQFLKGQAAISVTAYDLSKTLKEPAYRFDYSPEYPHGRNEEVEGRDNRVQVSRFRLKFVQRIASDIAVKFVASTPQRRVD